MEYRISHEVRFELIIEAASEAEAERIASETPYSDWEEKYVVREEYIAVSESPINPQGS